MKKAKAKIISAVIIVIIAAIYYYINIPAINIHEKGLWLFVFLLVLVILIYYMIKKKIKSRYEIKEDKFLKIGLCVLAAVVVIFVVGSLLSSTIINAKKYQKLLTVESDDYTSDIKEADFNQIPLMDKDSATLLGERKMGTMVDYVSQFEVSTLYSQINYNGRAVRVTPLEYAGFVKWMTNQDDGIPAYIMIDMTTQDTEVIKLDKPIKYSESERFNRNIYRHLRFKYPTYMFDDLSFEINDDGEPFWVCPVKKYTIGLFGGEDIKGVVLCNACTGECEYYKLEDCPEWIDKAVPADLLVEQYDYYGKLVNGFFNSIFGQKGCLKSTDGYNYIAMENDVWVYTGVTSVNSDQSNVGFVLMNQRTKETRYYEVSGAEEYSAMDSAEGQVQNLGYTATFPLLINVSGEPTYFMALKDDAGLVKKYAMVNIQRYQNVSIGDTVDECMESYISTLTSNGVTSQRELDTVTGAITKIVQCVIDGHSHFYITLDGDTRIYGVSVENLVQIIIYNVGDTITFEYEAGDDVSEVKYIK